MVSILNIGYWILDVTSPTPQLLPRVNPRLGQLTFAEATNSSLTSVYRQIAERRLEPSSTSRRRIPAGWRSDWLEPSSAGRYSRSWGTKMRYDAGFGESRPERACSAKHRVLKDASARHGINYKRGFAGPICNH